MADINHVVIVGNLTRDPELKHTAGGMPLAKLRVANNTRTKKADGEWGDKANYFDVTVWGKHGENCAQYLSKGKKVAISGRLDWREWDAQDGTKRQAIEIVADDVQFLTPRSENGGGSENYRSEGGGSSGGQYTSTAGDDVPFEGQEPAGVQSSGQDPDDDIPF